MILLFYREDGSEQQSRQYYAPGKFYFGQDHEICQEFDHADGDVVKFHVGHGTFRDYKVMAKDDTAVLLQMVRS